MTTPGSSVVNANVRCGSVRRRYAVVAWQRARSMSRFSFSQRSTNDDSSVPMSRVRTAPVPSVSKLAPAASAAGAAAGAAAFAGGLAVASPAAAQPAARTA